MAAALPGFFHSLQKTFGRGQCSEMIGVAQVSTKSWRSQLGLDVVAEDWPPLSRVIGYDLRRRHHFLRATAKVNHCRLKTHVGVVVEVVDAVARQPLNHLLDAAETQIIRIVGGGVIAATVRATAHGARLVHQKNDVNASVLTGCLSINAYGQHKDRCQQNDDAHACTYRRSQRGVMSHLCLPQSRFTRLDRKGPISHAVASQVGHCHAVWRMEGQRAIVPKVTWGILSRQKKTSTAINTFAIMWR